MSERSFAASCLVRLGYSHDKAESLIQGALDEHAHELAEEIRRHWYPKFPGKSEYTQGVDDGFDKAANLIDPEVP